MKMMKKLSFLLALAVVSSIPCFSVKRTQAATDLTVTTATGYTSASDVDYVKKGNYIANWGARGEDCTFLSTYAQSFYTGNYTYSVLSQNDGGSSQSNAPYSSLYSALQSMMKKKHTHITSYGETRDQYRYTDCVRSNYNNISSFYSGTVLNGNWDSAATWNREHTWPNSKGLGGSDENDIMMLRPTSVKENSSRGNTAYGKSSSYYYPGDNLRGDCARIVLYVYVRWGNTSRMWGTSGVMENMNVLLEWMEADPVDTWEMGRNDAVQAITGTRNVFVDYPEFAWQLFGRSIPTDMSTPSGIAEGEEDDSSSSGSSSEDSSSDSNSSSDSTSSSGDTSSGNSSSESDSATEEECNHEFGQWFELYPATEEWEGVEKRFCKHCDKTESRIIPPIDKKGCSGTVSILASVSAVLGACALLFVKKEEKK